MGLGIGVKQIPLGLSLEQTLLVALPVEIDDVGLNLTKERLIGQLMVDEDAPTATSCPQLPANHQSLVEPLHPCLTQDREQGLVSLNIEHSLDDSPRGTTADQIGRASLALQQSQGINDDRFPRSRLSAEQVQSRLELDLSLLD